MSLDISKDKNGLARRIADHILPPMAWLMCRILGIITWTLTKRRDDAIRNLAHAFPERDPKWHRDIAFKSVNRMFEMFAAPMVLPWLSENELRRRYGLAKGADERMSKVMDGTVSVVQAPHCATMEAMAMLPVLHNGLRFTTIYRPLDFPPADKYVLWARSYWGMKFLSRKESLLGIRHAMSRGENVGILFDQNALTAGALILSFGRVCSATDLPGILASRSHTKVFLVNAHRNGFLRATFDLTEIENDGTSADITVRSALVLENILRNNDEICADWMWAHRRWKSMVSRLHLCLSLTCKKNYLAASLHAMGLKELPRRQPYCLRVPNDPALAEIAAGWMPRLREARPDVRWIVVSPAASASFFTEDTNCERLITFDGKDASKALLEARAEWPEIYFSLERSSDSFKDAATLRATSSIGLSAQSAYHRRGHTRFHADASRLNKDAFSSLLDEVFKSCGLGKTEE